MEVVFAKLGAGGKFEHTAGSAYKVSGGLLFPTQTNTGLLFVTKDNVTPYQSTKTRYEGSDAAAKIVDRSGAIAHA